MPEWYNDLDLTPICQVDEGMEITVDPCPASLPTMASSSLPALVYPLGRCRILKVARAPPGRRTMRTSKTSKGQATSSAMQKAGNRKRKQRHIELAKSSRGGWEREKDRYLVRQKAMPRLLRECMEDGIIHITFNDSLGALGAKLQVKDKDNVDRFVEKIRVYESRRKEFNTRLVYYLPGNADRAIKVTSSSGLSQTVQNYFKYRVFIDPDEFKTDSKIQKNWSCNEWSFKPCLVGVQSHD